MNVKNYIHKRYLNHLKRLSSQLNLLTSANIAEEVTCDLYCYVISNTIKFIDYLLINNDENHPMPGNIGQSILQQLKKMLSEFNYYHLYDEEQGYKKELFTTQKWLDLVSFANATNDLLKNKIQELNTALQTI